MSTEIATIEKTEIEGFQNDGNSAIAIAKDIARNIKDNTSLDTAAKMMLEAKSRIRIIEDRLKEPRQKARAAWQALVDLTNELCEPYLRIEREILKPAMVKFTNDQELLRRQQEDKLREEQRKRTEDERIKAAAALEKEGERDAANELIEAPIEVAPVIIPKAEAPKGISYRDVWKYRIVDESKIPREYMVVDEQKIGAIVRALKNETKIAGIEVYSEKVIAGRA